MKDIALPVTSCGKQILDCDNDHIADCISVDVAAQIAVVLNSHYELLESAKQLLSWTKIHYPTRNIQNWEVAIAKAEGK